MGSEGWRLGLVGFLIGGLFVETVAGAGDEKDDKENEFAFNLFTDIAPILALFGEQFARQFMSESFTWLDHVIFAMVPLGIVAGITSAIRVQGPHIVRAFIGRARENKALVEYELMSSTSHEVGEAFNGQGIVRVLGRPRVAEFVIFPKQYNDAEEFYQDRDQKVPTDSQSSDSGTDFAVNDSFESDSSGSTKSSDHIEDDENMSSYFGTSFFSDKHEFCGIHSLESIIQVDDPDLMQYRAYHSQGYNLLQLCKETIQKWLMWFVSLSGYAVEYVRSNSVGDGFRDKKKKPDPETAETPVIDEEDTEEGIEDEVETTDGSSYSSTPERGPRHIPLGPPNLQLNLTPDHADHYQQHKRIVELYAVALVAVLLQTGLVVLAAATVYYAPLKKRIPYDSQSYGFPCYAAGTVLLCLGMGICSYAVERNSVEVEWTVDEAKDASSLPRLLFLQQDHSVNDQYFEAYTLLSGRKSRILGSARNPNSYSTKLVNKTWEWITVAGAVASGAGFTCQFMGLRGLTYPCSLAQLGAVILMVILRGFIRRGLGRESAHSPMLSGYELEHLAILITYLPEFRSFDEPERDRKDESEAEPLNQVFGWRVMLPGSRAQGLTPERLIIDLRNIKSQHKTKASMNPRLYVPSPSAFQPAASEQLLRVRRRLGSLCQWKSRVAEHALILTRSIEHFMDIFFPLEGDKRLPSVKKWEIPVAGPTEKDRVTFVITPEEKNNKRKWRVDIGKIEAVMSLWMAFKEARIQPSTTGPRPQRYKLASGKNESDWLRDEDGAKRQKFYRILGESTKVKHITTLIPDDDDSDSDNSDSDDSDSDDSDSDDSDQTASLLSVLERDIKWWVGDHFSLISRPIRNYRKDGQDPVEFDPWMSQSPHNLEIPDLAIGFNAASDIEDSEEVGHDMPQNQEAPLGRTYELGTISEGFLAGILTQHLFTSFIWAISKDLAQDCLEISFHKGNQDIEIEGRDQFDHNQFERTWYLPRLSHPKLRDAVRQIEIYGLGNKVDILLCMIPAFSRRDLLPNHAMLQLIPSVSVTNDWASIASCYHKLMMSTLEIRKPEKLCYSVTVHVMDFLELACKPYSKSDKPSEYLLPEIRKIVGALRSDHFLRVLQGIIAGLHNRQGRSAVFKSIICLYGGESDEWQELLRLYQEDQTSIAREELKTIVGYSDCHQKVFDRVHAERTFGLHLTHKELTAQDIFGWTPLHYCSASPKEKWTAASSLLWEHCRRPPFIKSHHFPDRLGRSALHIAASKGFEKALLWMTFRLAPSEKQNVLVSRGQDGMTLLHLAVLSQNEECLEFVTREEYESQTPITDTWGRESLHIASQTGNAKIVKTILGQAAWTLSKDLLGKTPIDYAIANNEQQTSDEAPVGQFEDTGDSQTVASPNPRYEILLELARIRPKWTDSNGKGFIHHAAEIGDPDLMRKLIDDVAMAGDTNMPDNDGKTPLHYAISAGKTDTALELLQKFEVDPLVEDKDRRTPLMLAVGSILIEVAKVILKSCSQEDLDKRTRSGESAVHFAEFGEGEGDQDAEKDGRLNMVKVLRDAGCSILQEDDRGETILHAALSIKDEPMWTYLLGLPRDELKGIRRAGRSLLILACSEGSTAAVPVLLELWPEMIQDMDEIWKRSPLSWACEEEHESIVRILAADVRTDLNYSSDTFGHGPLHLAADRKSSEILACLLEQDPSRYDLFKPDNDGRVPLALAIYWKRVETAKMLLAHPQTSDSDKVGYLKNLLGEDATIAHKFHDLIAWLFCDIPDSAIGSDDLLHLIGRAQSLRLWKALDVFVQRAMMNRVWEHMKYPYHAGIETSNFKLIADAIDHRLGFHDEDGWSLQDYASSWDRANILPDLDLGWSNGQFLSAERVPESLAWEKSIYYRKMSSCRAHDETICPGIQAINCTGQTYPPRTCTSTNQCVPYTSHGRYFYFEVSIRANSPSGLLALGFCSDTGETDGMPGSVPESWGFYGDTGHLLVRGVPTGEDKSLDLGYIRSFGAGDIVGVGWSSMTGEALCTWNGEKLRLGDETQLTIKRIMLNTGKKYPCIGHRMDVKGIGLQFRINLGLSPHHPFMYQGPFF